MVGTRNLHARIFCESKLISIGVKAQFFIPVQWALFFLFLEIRRGADVIIAWKWKNILWGKKVVLLNNVQMMQSADWLDLISKCKQELTSAAQFPTFRIIWIGLSVKIWSVDPNNINYRGGRYRRSNIADFVEKNLRNYTIFSSIPVSANIAKWANIP